MEPENLQPIYTPGTEESYILGISSRGWLALIIVITVCALSLMGREVKEPLYSALLIALGFYFGQKGK